MEHSSCYNEVDFNKIAVKVEINDKIAVYEDKRVNAARNKGIHELIDTLFCDWNFHFCKPFRESMMIHFPEILMYKWYHHVTVLVYYLIRENVKTIPLLTVVNVILSDYRYYTFSKSILTHHGVLILILSIVLVYLIQTHYLISI